jgi:hypothetical protein
MLWDALMPWVSASAILALAPLTQEVCVVMLDIGAQMGDLLDPAAKTVSEFIQGKVHHGHVASKSCVHLLAFSLVQELTAPISIVVSSIASILHFHAERRLHVRSHVRR